MEVILLERIEKLGHMGDVVEVKAGYARNFLLPANKALRATKANRSRFEAEREFLETRNAQARENANLFGEKLNNQSYVAIRKAGETGMLYGSVNSHDIAELIGGEVKRNMILLEHPIKTLGLHTLKLKLHPEVLVNVTINVARTEAEAERQAKGEDVINTHMQTDMKDSGIPDMEQVDMATDIFEDSALPPTETADKED